MKKAMETLKGWGFKVTSKDFKAFGETNGTFFATAKDETGAPIGIFWFEAGDVVYAWVDKFNGTHKEYFDKSEAQMLAICKQCIFGHNLKNGSQL